MILALSPKSQVVSHEPKEDVVEARVGLGVLLVPGPGKMSGSIVPGRWADSLRERKKNIFVFAGTDFKIKGRYRRI